MAAKKSKAKKPTKAQKEANKSQANAKLKGDTPGKRMKRMRAEGTAKKKAGNALKREAKKAKKAGRTTLSKAAMNRIARKAHLNSGRSH